MTKSMIKVIGLMGLVAIFSFGCKTTDQDRKPDGGIIGGPIPSSSKFAKVTIGMSVKELYDTIGQPNDHKAYVTGKSFIPFYFGADSVRSEVFYKGEGRITLTGGGGFGGRPNSVYRIVYDPKESGYSR